MSFLVNIPLIQSTISSLKTAGEIAKSFLELKSISEVQGKVIQLQSVILSAQSSALEAQANESAMVEEVRNLKEEIARIKAWEKEKQRYKLVSTLHGLLLYALKESCSASEPPHWICTKCYEDGRKSILNPFRKPDESWFILICPACKTQYFTGKLSAPVAEYTSE